MSETRSVVVRLSMEAADYIRNAQTAGKVGEDAMRKVEKSAMSADQAVDKIGSTAGKVAAGGIAALFGTGKLAVDWESQWAGVTKTVDGTTSQMAELEEGLRGLATTLPATHEEIAGVAEAAGQLGIAREDVVDFTATMVDLSETTNLSAEQAATSIAQISNVMGTASEDVDNFGAALVALGNDGASTEAEILEMAQRIAGAGAQIGLAESDILAIANAAASMGINAEAGGSSISRVFTELAKATSTGGDKLVAFADVAGMSASEFARAFEEDPARAFASFTRGLDQINASGGDVFTVLDQLGLADVRVSQSLLGMAASGDLLTDSLNLGAEAWEDNTALALEAAKRYDTTAAQVQVSWNKVKDAGIEAGESLLPVAAGIADKVGAIADAFGRLPDPVQTAFVELLGIGTLTAGAAWLGIKTISKVNSAREALQALETQSPKTAKAVSRIGKAAGIAAIAITGLDVAISSTTESDPVAGMEATTKAILDMAEGAGGAKGAVDDLFDRDTSALGGPLKMTSEIDGLRSAFEALQTGGFTKFLEDPIFMDSRWDLASQSFEQLDAAMTNLVKTGNTEAAASMFEYFNEVAKDSGLSASEAADLLPDYADALVGLENEAKLAAESQNEAAEATDELGDAMAAAIPMTEEQAEALKAVREAGRETAESFVGLGDSLDDAEVSLSGWLAEMEQSNRDLANFRDNARKAGKKGLDDGLVLSLHQAGEVGARRMRELANATEGEIDRANRAWRRQQDEISKTEDQAARLAGMSPVNLRFNAETGEAMSRLEIIKAQLDSIDRFVPVNIHVTRTGGAGGDLPYLSGGARRSAGGPVYGPGTATSDSIPAYLSNGEYVVKAAAVQKYGVHMFDSLNAMRLADGGPVIRGGKKDATNAETLAVLQAAQAIRQIVRDLNKDGKERLKGRAREIAQIELKIARENLRDAKEARGQSVRDRIAERLQAAADRQLEAAQEQKAAAQEALTNAEKNRDTVLGAMADLAAATTAGFRTGLFETTTLPSERTGNLWLPGTPGERVVGGPLENLTKDIAGLEERLALQGQLAAAGLSGEAWSAVLSQGTNEDLAGLLQRNEVGAMQAAFNRRAELLGITGDNASGYRFGADLAAANAAVAEATRQVADASQAVARAERFASQAAESASLSASQLAELNTAVKAMRPFTIVAANNPRATAREVARRERLSGV